MKCEREQILPVSWAVLRFISGMIVAVRGAPPSDERQILSVVPHTSHLDTLALITALGTRAQDLSIVVKGPYWNDRKAYRMLLALVAPGFIALEADKTKENYQKMVNALTTAEKEKKQLLLGIFPQGTRQRDHKLEHGHAVLSAHTGVPITPVVIEHMPTAFSDGDLSLASVLRFSVSQYLKGERNTPVTVSFLGPIFPPTGMHFKHTKEHIIFEYNQRLVHHEWQDQMPGFMLESQGIS